MVYWLYIYQSIRKGRKISINALNLNHNLELNIGLSLNQQLMLSILKMDFTDLHTFITNEFDKNPALEGEIPSLIALPDFQISYDTTKDSLKNDLLLQLHTTNTAPSLEICEYIIDSIDTHGYLTQSPLEISAQLVVPLSLVDDCISFIQAFEPLGIGAQNLQESLLIQLKTLYPNDSITTHLVINHWASLLNKDFDALIKETTFSLEEVTQSLHILGTLNPIPGNGFYNHESTKFIAPDILLYDDDDDFIIEMPNLGLDQMRLNPSYIDPHTLSKYKNLIKDDLDRANIILKALQNRQSTLFQIANIIINTQKEYLKYNNPLSSLKLMDIASILGVHESTVSRGICGKYILYNEQLIELRSLLSRSTPNGTSTDQIKKRLLWIIKNENKAYPFSDPQLVGELQYYGLKISRRTVAKYRLELGIESAKQRKTQTSEVG